MSRFAAPLPAKRAHRPRQLSEETLETCVDLALIQPRLKHKRRRFVTAHLVIVWYMVSYSSSLAGQELQSCPIVSPLLEDPL